MAHESGPHRLLAIDRLSSRPGVPSLRRTLSRRPPAARLHLLGSVSRDGLRRVDLSRESLRDIEACLGSLQGKLYHLGFRGKVARPTPADANESRDWCIFADFAQMLIRIARALYVADPIGVGLGHRRSE